MLPWLLNTIEISINCFNIQQFVTCYCVYSKTVWIVEKAGTRTQSTVHILTTIYKTLHIKLKDRVTRTNLLLIWSMVRLSRVVINADKQLMLEHLLPLAGDVLRQTIDVIEYRIGNHCVICPSIYRFWFSLWYLQTLLVYCWAWCLPEYVNTI
jgi:hypothetical protein